MPQVEVWSTVDVDLDDFDTDDLIEELEKRGKGMGPTSAELVTKIWLKRRNGQDYQQELDQLIYTVTGHIV